MSVETLLKIMRPLVIFITICFFYVLFGSLSFVESVIIVIIAIITAIKMFFTSFTDKKQYEEYARARVSRVSIVPYATVPGVSITVFFVLVFVWLIETPGQVDFGIILGFIVGPVIVRIFAKMCFRSLEKDQAVTLDFIRTKTNVHEADIHAEAEIGWSGKIYLSITLLNQTLQEQTGMGSRQRFENHVDILHDIRLQEEKLRGDRHPPPGTSHQAGNKSIRGYTYHPVEDAWRLRMHDGDLET